MSHLLHGRSLPSGRFLVSPSMLSTRRRYSRVIYLRVVVEKRQALLSQKRYAFYKVVRQHK